jgi:uncharacterized protein (TIGR03083 family)
MNDRKQAVIADWDRQHEETVALLETLRPEDFDRATACEGWTVLDQATHLAAAAAVLPPQIERMRRREPNPGFEALQRRNVEGLAARRGRGLPELIAEFREAHAGNRALLLALPEEELDVEGPLVTGELITIEERFRRAGLHYLEHADYIRQALAR